MSTTQTAEALGRGREIARAGALAAAKVGQTATAPGRRATFRIWRGDASGGKLQDYSAELSEGMVVLDAVHQIQAEQANDLAVRWNCKAGKCGSSSRCGPSRRSATS